MGTRVKLSEIVGEMELQHDQGSLYLNQKTGEVVLLIDEEMLTAEEEESSEELPEWQREAKKVAKDILENRGNYVELPSKVEINEYRIMEDFCHSVEDRGISEKLSDAIKGRGAFGRFKDNIVRMGIEDRWYKYKNETLKRMALEWCEENHIDYLDE
jgi:hypothetical protein